MLQAYQGLTHWTRKSLESEAILLHPSVSRSSHSSVMKVVIGGGTGFIGKALHNFLTHAGHTVRVVTRTPQTITDISWDSIGSAGLPKDTEVVINLAGRNIGEINPIFVIPRFYQQYLADVFSSRVNTTKLLVKALDGAPVKTFINASAVGFYPPSFDVSYTESQEFQYYGVISRLVKEWEDAAQIPGHLNMQHYQLRFGVVLAKNSGFIKALYPSHRVGLGGPVGSGLQWISWVHLEDVIRVINTLLTGELPIANGPINITSPYPCRQFALSKAFSEAIGAPKIPCSPLTTPAFVGRLMLGHDRATLLLDGQRVIPRKLLDSGFQFKYAHLEDALESMFQRRPSAVPTD